MVNPKFLYSGGPVYRRGWINTLPEDQRMMLNIGPFTLINNQPIDIIVAYIVGRVTDPLNSISVARDFVDSAFNEYNSNFAIVTNIKDNSINKPTNYFLYQNYPNPFNQSTTIRFDLPERAIVNSSIYNVLGQKVTELLNKEIEAGYHKVEFNASILSAEIYFYRLQAKSTEGKEVFTETKKLVLIK